MHVQDMLVVYAIHFIKIYIGETGRRLGDRFREHVLNNATDKEVSVIQCTRTLAFSI